jgi:hypothetical protein
LNEVGADVAEPIHVDVQASIEQNHLQLEAANDCVGVLNGEELEVHASHQSRDAREFVGSNADRSNR